MYAWRSPFTWMMKSSLERAALSKLTGLQPHAEGEHAKNAQEIAIF
jgi:hypothetical protein